MFNMPRPLLSTECDISIKALYVGEQHRDAFRRAVMDMTSTTEINIPSKEIKIEQREDIPETLSVTIEQNRLRLNALAAVADKFSEEAGDENVMGNIAIETTPFYRSRIPRPLADKNNLQSTFIIEISGEDTSFELSDAISKKFQVFDTSTFMEERGVVVIQTGEDVITIQKLAELRKLVERFNVPTENVIITCGVREL